MLHDRAVRRFAAGGVVRVVGRLLAIGAKTEAVRENFSYIRPADAVTALSNRMTLDSYLEDLAPTLAVLDGITEAMTLHGLS